MPAIRDPQAWTVGCEFELSDWNCLADSLPMGCSRSPDYTIVNSNGIAAQPNVEHYAYGGEVNTPPSREPIEQCNILRSILARTKNTGPQATVNYRSNLHVHVRVPGLNNDLRLLKQVQRYIHDELPAIISLVEPLELPARPGAPEQAVKKRLRRMRVSHQTFLTPQRLKHQLAAKTVREFFEREVPMSKAGRVMWHAQPRLCVGLRQLLQTDTVEFRHFPGTIDPTALHTAIDWCWHFMRAAIGLKSLATVWQQFRGRQFPRFLPFDYQLETGYQATAAHNGLSRKEIERNINLILQGRFYGSSAERGAQSRACGL